MKFSVLALLIAVYIPFHVSCHRLLEAQEASTIIVEKEIPWVDENPGINVMIPEEKYIDPPKNIVQEVIEVVPPPKPEPKIIAVVALSPEEFEKLSFEKKVVEVESVGDSQD